jgi:PEP-CTERM motif
VAISHLLSFILRGTSMKIRWFLRVVALVLATAGVTPCFAASFDLTSDWSDAANPNGVWTYRGDSNVLPHVSNWASANGVPPGQDAWAPGRTTPPGFLPAWMKVTTVLPLLGDETAIGDIVTHTFDSTNGAPGFAEANVIWTAPAAGVADITGKLWQARNLAGRNQHWTLFVNGVDTAHGDFIGGSATPFTKNTNPATFSDLGVSVFGGEVVELRVATTAGFGDFVGASEHVNFSPSAATVPEPSTFALLGIGSLGLLGLAYRRRKLAA